MSGPASTSISSATEEKKQDEGEQEEEAARPPSPLTSLPFPPVTATHILNCSFHSWYFRLRSQTPKARLVALTQPFLDYLRADGIVLPPDAPRDGDSGYSDDEDDENDDPSRAWADVHQKVYDTIEELGGKVIPKLNWSAPKDATFMSTTNDLECRTPNDIYLLLKSSDFVTHDLEHPFDDCTDTQPIQYHLVLRKSFQLNPSLEFRVFVRNRRIIGICQREMNHFPFLSDMRSRFKARIQDSIPDFPDPNFVFDVYIPPPHKKVWIIDINPWAPRTDPLLFSWLELLTMPDVLEEKEEDDDEDDNHTDVESATILEPEFRLVGKNDPEAYQFATTKYSAHKLPRDVVDASMTPSAMKEMMDEWKKAQDGDRSDDDDDNDNITV